MEEMEEEGSEGARKRQGCVFAALSDFLVLE